MSRTPEGMHGDLRRRWGRRLLLLLGAVYFAGLFYWVGWQNGHERGYAQGLAFAQSRGWKP